MHGATARVFWQGGGSEGIPLMRGVLIGLGAFYASLFVIGQWGWEAGAFVLMSALVLDRVIKAMSEGREKRAVEEIESRRADSARTEYTLFRRTGCRFLGSGEAVFIFEHPFDANRYAPVDGGGCYSPDARRVAPFNGGFVVAVNPNGWWPTQYDAASLSRLLTLLSRPVGLRGLLEFRRIPPSPEAGEYDRTQRQALLADIEAKVAARAASLAGRLATDLGPHAIAVYVITTPARNASKIGVSNNPERRRAGLQTGNAQHLTIHRAFWMQSRAHATMLEAETHKLLEKRGFLSVGEWFDVDPELACRFVTEAFSSLVDTRLIAEAAGTVTAASTDEAILRAVADRIVWGFSKRRNLVALAFGRKVTVYNRRGQWRFVVDGEFSTNGYPSPDVAQLECLRALSPTREQALAFLASASE